MTLIQTQDLRPGQLDRQTNLQVYCGLDCCVTLEVLEELNKQFPSANPIYDFERALQAPYLEIMQRGFAVDTLARMQASAELRSRIGHLSGVLDEFARAVWGKGLNPRSPPQLRDFFYSRMKLPEVWLNQKGERKLSTNREALEKLEVYLYARPFISIILAIRDLAKQLEVFETEIDSDGRFRTSYNIAGTETGRPSSSSNAFGTGGNAQNIAPALRYVFVADSGWKLAVIDLEQVEARDVGFFCGCLFDDWTFLDSCERGKLHVNNSKRIWPELKWTENEAQNRKIADQLFYRDFSYYDFAKRAGHLSHYIGTAWTAARVLKMPIAILDDFQQRYIKGPNAAYPCIALYWQWVAQQLQTTHQLVTPFGRRRHFFGRPNDDTTLREAVAYLPQGTTADRMSLGMWRVWKYMPEVQLLAETFDSIAFQFRETEDENAVVGKALKLIEVELFAPNGRRYVVPGEAKTGWNWGSEVTTEDSAKALAKGKKLRANPEGLRKWNTRVPDLRVRRTGLNRVMT